MPLAAGVNVNLAASIGGGLIAGAVCIGGAALLIARHATERELEATAGENEDDDDDDDEANGTSGTGTKRRKKKKAALKWLASRKKRKISVAPSVMTPAKHTVQTSDPSFYLRDAAVPPVRPAEALQPEPSMPLPPSSFYSATMILPVSSHPSLESNLPPQEAARMPLPDADAIALSARPVSSSRMALPSLATADAGESENLQRLDRRYYEGEQLRSCSTGQGDLAAAPSALSSGLDASTMGSAIRGSTNRLTWTDARQEANAKELELMPQPRPSPQEEADPSPPSRVSPRLNVDQTVSSGDRVQRVDIQRQLQAGKKVQHLKQRLAVLANERKRVIAEMRVLPSDAEADSDSASGSSGASASSSSEATPSANTVETAVSLRWRENKRKKREKRKRRRQSREQSQTGSRRMERSASVAVRTPGQPSALVLSPPAADVLFRMRSLLHGGGAIAVAASNGDAGDEDEDEGDSGGNDRRNARAHRERMLEAQRVLSSLAPVLEASRDLMLMRDQYRQRVQRGAAQNAGTTSSASSASSADEGRGRAAPHRRRSINQAAPSLMPAGAGLNLLRGSSLWFAEDPSTDPHNTGSALDYNQQACEMNSAREIDAYLNLGAFAAINGKNKRGKPALPVNAAAAALPVGRAPGLPAAPLLPGALARTNSFILEGMARASLPLSAPPQAPSASLGLRIRNPGGASSAPVPATAATAATTTIGQQGSSSPVPTVTAASINLAAGRWAHYASLASTGSVACSPLPGSMLAGSGHYGEEDGGSIMLSPVPALPSSLRISRAFSIQEEAATPQGAPLMIAPPPSLGVLGRVAAAFRGAFGMGTSSSRVQPSILLSIPEAAPPTQIANHPLPARMTQPSLLPRSSTLALQPTPQAVGLPSSSSTSTSTIDTEAAHTTSSAAGACLIAVDDERRLVPEVNEEVADGSSGGTAIARVEPGGAGAGAGRARRIAFVEVQAASEAPAVDNPFVAAFSLLRTPPPRRALPPGLTATALPQAPSFSEGEHLERHQHPSGVVAAVFGTLLNEAPSSNPGPPVIAVAEETAETLPFSPVGGLPFLSPLSASAGTGTGPGPGPRARLKPLKASQTQAQPQPQLSTEPPLFGQP